MLPSSSCPSVVAPIPLHACVRLCVTRCVLGCSLLWVQITRKGEKKQHKRHKTLKCWARSGTAADGGRRVLAVETRARTTTMTIVARALGYSADTVGICSLPVLKFERDTTRRNGAGSKAARTDVKEGSSSECVPASQNDEYTFVAALEDGVRGLSAFYITNHEVIKKRAISFQLTVCC